MRCDRTLCFLTACFCVLCGTQVVSCVNDIFELSAVSDEWHQRDTRVAIRNDQERSVLGCERPNIYICEEPPDAFHFESAKRCNYRNMRYHEQVYRWVAGRGCLLYIPDFLYQAGYNTVNLTASCIYEGMFAPCLEIAKEDGTCGCYPYDPAFEEVANEVRRAVVPAAHGRWERCFYTASDCCSHHMNGSITENHCEPTFDGWTCWHEAEANTVANEICSEFAYSNVGPSCHHYSTKQCYSNGVWELQTDYSSCSVTPRLARRYRFHIAMLSFSIASCLPAVFIFFFYKRLRIPRVALHRNLLIAIIVRNILVIVSRSEIYIDELTTAGDTVMSTHGVACRVLAVAERTAANMVFVAMLVEGIFLHRMIAAVFRSKFNLIWLYGIGFAIGIIPVQAWAIVMGILNDHSCWLIYTVDNIQWILDAPRIAILLVNTILFVDVLRVLLTKLRNSENANQLSTTKATLFLMPIFGTQFLLTAFRPSTTDCVGEQVYYYVSYTVEGLQGFVVALLYCYINKEVHTLIKSTYRKTENAVVSHIRGESSNPRMSLGRSDRRFTYSTALPSRNDEHIEHQYSTIPPKLHVAEIISIKASEKLADMLDPVYETVRNGVVNEGYDSLDRDKDSGFIPNRDSKDDYYAFTNASSISIECQDWIRCVSSPSSSVYNNSLNDYETKYLERKFPNHPKLREINEARTKQSENIAEKENDVAQELYETAGIVDEKGEVTSELETGVDSELDIEMLDEIMQYIENNENKDVILNPALLRPNRKQDDKVIFVDE